MGATRQQQAKDRLVRPAAVARALVRPSTYAGLAKEAALVSFYAATYPLGLLPTRGKTPDVYAPRHLQERSLLAQDPEAAWSPVILVHGYIHNRSAFAFMSRALRRSGFQFVHGLNYNPLTATFPELTERLGEQVEQALQRSGARTCQIVGHSMGGIIARHFAQEYARPGTVDTVVTLASPHRGTHAAHVGFGQAVAELLPGSSLLRRLEETARPSDTRWISYYSNVDVTIIPAHSAKLVHPALDATNIKVRNTGHLSFLLSGEVVGSVIRHLSDRRLGRDTVAEPGVPVSAGASA